MLYWVTNTLLEDLSNEQMLAIARSAQASALSARAERVARA